MSWTEQKGAQPPPQFTAREEESEWLSRTAKEIAQINLDVHGITDGLEALGLSTTNIENEESLLSNLDAELSNIPENRKSVFTEAQRVCPQLVNAKARLAFLRTEEYNAKLAANRLAAYWEQKKKLFGAEKCFLPVTLKGALEDDGFALSLGLVRILPWKDKQGRQAIFLNPICYKPGLCSTESLLRACWYTLSVASEHSGNESLVLLSSGRDFSCFQHFNYELYKGFADLEKFYLPVRFRSCHHCYPSIYFHLTSPIAKYFIGARLRGRFICHFGTETDVLNKLESYGFFREKLPVDVGGELVLDQREWLLHRLASEEEIDNFEVRTVEKEKTHPVMMQMGNGKITNADVGLKEIASSVNHQANVARRMLSTEEKNAYDEDLFSSSRVNRQTSKTATAFNKGDPRMNSALAAKLKKPEMSLLDALLEGGFEFTDLGKSRLSAKKIFDTENVSLYQRKNQLNRRIRKETKRQRIDASECKAKDLASEYSVSADHATSRASLDAQGLGLPQISPQQTRSVTVSHFENCPSIVTQDCQPKPEESPKLMCLSKHSLPHSLVRRDSFDNLITELPGLDDLPGDLGA